MQGPFIAFVGNLAYTAVKDDIENYFHDGGCNVKDVTIQMGDNGRPRNFAFVEFDNRESLIKALTVSGTNMMGREIR